MTDVEALLREVRELRETVEGLRRQVGERPRVILRSLQAEPYLGQPVDVVATVTRPDSSLLTGVPVTFTASWGRLRTAEGLHPLEAAGVTVRTDERGEARVILLPPTAGDVTAARQEALETALRRLDPKAPTPEEAAGGLRELARQYRLEGNVDLRQAIDLYLQDFGQRWRAAFESRVHALWPVLDTTVFAFARDGDPDDEDALDTAVLATAVLPLRLRDWLGPFLQVLGQVMAEDDDLAGDLLKARDRFKEPDALIGHVYGRVQLFLEGQPGVAAELAGRRAADTSLRSFLDDGLPDLPKETRAGVLQGIEAASGTLRGSGAGVLGAVRQTRKDLAQKLDLKIAEVPRVDLTDVNVRIDQIAGQVSTQKVSLETLSTNLNRDLGALRETTTRLNDRVSRIDTSVTRFSTDLTDLRERSTQLDQRVTTLNTSVTRIDDTVRTRVFRPNG